MPTTTATATTTALEWSEIIPGVWHSELPDSMTAEIITGFHDSWAIYDFEDNLIASGHGQGVPGCKVNVARVLNDL